MNVPGRKSLNKFPTEFRGSFGRFQTADSFALNYLTTNVAIDEIDQLSTASEVFGIDTIRFEELIQRNIDFKRVQKIANEYLSKGHGRVVFFPPLLACVALLNSEKKLQPSFGAPTRTTEDSAMRTTWDSDGFQLDLQIASADESDRTTEWLGEQRYYFDYAAALRINPRRTRLVVLDGQHRLEALRLLRRNPASESIIDALEIPVCIVWAPEARPDTDELITRDFRELFVTVNSEPQKVSGHFITLLEDDSYSAMAVRELADYWKRIPGDWSRLHLLEWNTRENERVEQRTRTSSLTTVSILARVMQDYLFKPGLAPDLLDLESRAMDFEKIDPSFDWSELRDVTQSPAIDLIVKQQIDANLVPALDKLLRKLKPYERLEERVNCAFEKLRARVADNNSAFVSLNKYLASYIYREDEMFDESARGAYADFKGWLSDYEADEVFLLNVFQQALLRFWLKVASFLAPLKVSTANTADGALSALERFAVRPTTKGKRQFLDSDQPYVRRVLWKGGNINYSPAWAKEAWSNILLATLVRDDVRTAIVEAVTPTTPPRDWQTKLNDQLEQLGFRVLYDYRVCLKRELERETRNYLADFFGDVEAARLGVVKQTDYDQYEKIVAEKAEERFSFAVEQLANVLEISTDDLLRKSDVA